jgi:hypothetical protein
MADLTVDDSGPGMTGWRQRLIGPGRKDVSTGGDFDAVANGF